MDCILSEHVMALHSGKKRSVVVQYSMCGRNLAIAVSWWVGIRLRALQNRTHYFCLVFGSPFETVTVRRNTEVCCSSYIINVVQQCE